MPLKIKNWKLTLLGLFFVCVFAYLGCWQLSRAQQKKLLLKSFAERTAHAPFVATDLNTPSDWRFYRAQLQGTFDNQHSILLDNKIVNEQVGYEVYTPFHALGLQAPILVDRGFVPMGATRRDLPVVKPTEGLVTIAGMLNFAPIYVAFGPMSESPTTTWPLRVEYIKVTELSKFVGFDLYPYILNITPKDASAYAVEWQAVTMPPERHMGYAVQWFALALTLLILSVALNWDRKK